VVEEVEEEEEEEKEEEEIEAGTGEMSVESAFEKRIPMLKVPARSKQTTASPLLLAFAKVYQRALPLWIMRRRRRSWTRIGLRRGRNARHERRRMRGDVVRVMKKESENARNAIGKEREREREIASVSESLIEKGTKRVHWRVPQSQRKKAKSATKGREILRVNA